ncbi:MAG: hypothetical protein ACRETL_09575, partial [Gammaproteobacteria bacterium]
DHNSPTLQNRPKLSPERVLEQHAAGQFNEVHLTDSRTTKLTTANRKDIRMKIRTFVSLLAGFGSIACVFAQPQITSLAWGSDARGVYVEVTAYGCADTDYFTQTMGWSTMENQYHWWLNARLRQSIM